ncbi:MAG: chitobiase/beta-hexosaminidase C-terminal domain-containing protein, partial [Bifidobacteriaceae bacterium]|nr:chitobiase/beta-hexosaminidase C-terminal domain-containing protein [Bifidobacteriaceae bacterium]
YINELSTSGTKANEDDWLELYNASDSFIYLGPGIRLWRDGTKKGDTFDFTGLLVPPHAYRILYADEKTSQGPDHLSFDFKKSGEVNLTDMSSGSVRVIDAFAYGEQLYLETHARMPDGGPIALMAEETYGYSNDKAAQKYALNFSHDRGVYDTGFTLTLTSVAGATIRYTTDGSTPSATKGTVYLGSIAVSKSMSVRAIAYDSRGTSTPQTMTYVLLDNLKNEVAGTWGRWTAANKATINDAAYAEALTDLPIVSINSDVVELSHSAAADYVQGYFEYMPEPGSGEDDYAQPIGVKRFGQASLAQYNSGIAVRFKKDYGAGKAKYEFFDPMVGEPYALTGEYKKLELHEGQDGAQADGWYAPGYLRYDEMMTRILANQMGIFDSHVQYVHYFYNGQYAGVKSMREDYGPHTFEPYFGVDSDDYTKVSYQDDGCFVAGCVEAGDGDVAVMRAVHQAANSGNYQTFQQYVDVESLIRNMILFHYIDCENEWNGVVQNSVGSGGMKMMFNINDSDGAFYNQGQSSITYSYPMDGGGGNYRYKWLGNLISQAGPYGMFRTWTRYDTADQTDGNLEFKTRVKDDVLEMIGPASGDFRGAPGAPLSVDNVQALLLEQQTFLDASYRLDAAYMGAANQWQVWKNYNPKVIALVPERTKFNLEQWAKIGLTHTLPAVVATSAGGGVTLSVAASAVIYYTLDGSDPMGANGATPGQAGANPAAQAYTAGTVLPAGATTRAFTTNNWGPITHH